MRFALGIINYDVTNFQPHFPAYPVYCGITKAFYAISGNLGISFAISGGLAIFLIAYYLPLFVHKVPHYVLALVIICNPYLWLLSNRFMPDLLGVGVLVAGIFYFKKAFSNGDQISVTLLGVCAGLLLGVRVSYFPFLLIPVLIVLIKSKHKSILLLSGAITVVIWLVPLVIDTGWSNLITAAKAQTDGHFNTFGGTIINEPDLLARFKSIFIYTWSDGLSGWVPGRHWLTLSLTVILVPALLLGLTALPKLIDKRVVLILLSSATLYFIWVLFFQNVLHKSRHLLPFIPFALALATYGFYQLKAQRNIQLVLSILLIVAQISIAIPMTIQHKKPTAIAKASNYLKQYDGINIKGPALLHYYMSKSGVQYQYIPDSTQEIHQQEFYSFGKYSSQDFILLDDTTFYHNPYINRMWSEVTIYHYRHAK